MTASSDVRARLVSEGVAGAGVASGSAWVVLEGGLSDAIDAPQIAVIDTTGMPPIDAHNTIGNTRPGVQILIRGAPLSYAATKTKMQTVWVALHRQRFETLQILEAVGSPIWLGYTSDERRPQWSLNFVAFK